MGTATTTSLVEIHYEGSWNVCMVSAIALVTGVSAVSVGSLLLRTWLRHGGACGTSHFRRIQILGHAAVGILEWSWWSAISQPAGIRGLAGWRCSLPPAPSGRRCSCRQCSGEPTSPAGAVTVDLPAEAGYPRRATLTCGAPPSCSARRHVLCDACPVSLPVPRFGSGGEQAVERVVHSGVDAHLPQGCAVLRCPRGHHGDGGFHFRS